MTPKPVFANAPGHSIKRLKDKWQLRWVARRDLIAAGYRPKHLRLWEGTEPNDAERAWISDTCNAQQNDMLVWGRGGIVPVSTSDNSLARLMQRYRTDTLSNYYKGECAAEGGLEYCTRRYYDRLMIQISKTEWADEDGVKRLAGDVSISAIKGRTVHLWHQIWSENDKKVSMGHALVGMLRTLVNFGAAYLDDLECARVAIILRSLKFKNAPPRDSQITRDQVIRICNAARDKHPMIALGQAIQFEFGWRIKDFVGEYVPNSDRAISEILDGNKKWIKGLRWEEIDANFVVHHVTSKKKKLSEPDLKLAPLTLRELGHIWPGCYEIDGDTVIPYRGALPAKGPVIVDPKRTGLPYTDYDFRNTWREYAIACDVPLDVQSRDTRAGFVSEAIAIGANPEHVRDMATHSDLSQTRDYSRSRQENTSTVMRLRAKLNTDVK